VVDDDPDIRQQLGHLYKQIGCNAIFATSAEAALELLGPGDIDLVVADIRLPGISGVDLTQRIQERWPDVPVIAITGYPDIKTAVDVLKLGASDYIPKPFSPTTLRESTQVLLKKMELVTEIRHLRQRIKEKCEFGGMLSKTEAMHRVFEVIRMVSDTDVSVVVEGETGTGKELVASAIHYQSARRNGPLITINCGGFPETLLESELFGYERGAFTGADRSRPGKIELAQGGTLFLDEIENMSQMMQAKLLLVLQNQTVQRLGSTHWTHVNMRVIAASNIPLKDLVASGQMRRDFYFRLNVVPIRLIPLRQRAEDIPLLVQDYLHHHPIAIQKRITKLSARAMDQLMRYPWPGNIRELQNVLEKAIVLTKSRVIESVDLPEDSPTSIHAQDSVPDDLPLIHWIRAKEREYLRRKLEAFKGRIDLTARSCGVDVRTIHRKLRLHALDKKAFQSTRPPVPPLVKIPPNKFSN
jgi:DNA-binding NtrC family response regulator